MAILATVWFQNWVIKLCFSMIAGFLIGRLFIIGHDACHQSLTTHRRLNRWIGRIVFLPSLTPYSLWDIGHNMVHHGYTNLKGFDFVWHPKSLEEFQTLSPWRRKLERLYRSGWAPGLYYMVEIWWTRMYFPSRRQMPTRRSIFFLDGLLVTTAAACWIGGLTFAAIITGQSIFLLLLTGFVVPFLFWNAMIGFVVYVHHTHVGIAWYDEKKTWAVAQPFVSTTVHLTFRYHIGALLHHIMEHTAHHVDMSVPLYRLKQAQKILEAKLPGRIVIQNFSWRWYFETVKRCKLYDFKRRCWVDFSGKPTSESINVVSG
jgi:omega-6 fatty acid desaturase (delta-12 desaturase)